MYPHPRRRRGAENARPVSTGSGPQLPLIDVAGVQSEPCERTAIAAAHDGAIGSAAGAIELYPCLYSELRWIKRARIGDLHIVTRTAGKAQIEVGGGITVIRE